MQVLLLLVLLSGPINYRRQSMSAPSFHREREQRQQNQKPKIVVLCRGQKRKKIHTQAKSHWKDFTGISPLSRATASLSHEKWFLSFFSFIIKNRKMKKKKNFKWFLLPSSSFFFFWFHDIPVERAGAIEKIVHWSAIAPLDPPLSLWLLPRCLVNFDTLQQVLCCAKGQ